ncbi:MAG: 4-(cytidine 5'-diphospho)-2-C-methyl-D-erythritol kinase [Rhizobiaceae bacterium]|nr:4-(cytidine 5'-diphospho)-2-C-methyl-D-erythritol kinase [Rhizobiaceae bacterium]
MPELTVPVVEHAPAKINLALHVTGKRPDGYHLLESLVVFTEVGDRISVAEASHDAFEISGPFAQGLECDASNLVLRARDAFRAHTPCSKIRITLEKNLPIASGIGGGSSDAAATLRALARLTGKNDDLSPLAAKLGADVPMCLPRKPLIARGIGEIIEQISSFPRLWLVLVNPGVHVATPLVFKGLTDPNNASLPPMPAHPDFSSLVEWLRESRNDLQIPAEALAPQIITAMAAIASTQPAFARMSGSGATCFGLYPNQSAAERAAATIRARRPEWFVAATRTLP